MTRRMLFHILLLIDFLVLVAAIVLMSIEVAAFGIITLLFLLNLSRGRAGELTNDPESVAMNSDEPV